MTDSTNRPSIQGYILQALRVLDLEDEVQDYKADARALRNIGWGLKSKLNTAQAEVEALKGSNLSLKAQVEDLKGSNLSLKKQADKMRDDRSRAFKRAGGYALEADKMEAALKASRAQVQEQRARGNGYLKEVQQLEVKLKDAQAAIDLLTADLEDERAKSAAFERRLGFALDAAGIYKGLLDESRS